MRWAHKDVKQWHKWFAWYPVQLDDASKQWVWFETIERKLVDQWWDDCWFYREAKCSTIDTQTEQA
jgi:hypothetical protein